MTVRFDAGGGPQLLADFHGRWNGPPIVLLPDDHSLSVPTWLAASSLLADNGFLVVSLSMAERRSSGAMRCADYSLDGVAASVGLAVDQLGGKAALVGRGISGLTALIAAALQPAISPTALVLIDMVGRHFRAPSMPRVCPTSAGKTAAVVVSPAESTVVTADQVLLRLERTPAQVMAPTLLVHDQQVEVDDQSELETLLRVAPRAQQLNLARASGGFDGDRRAIFARSVLDFLAPIHDI